MSSLFYVEGNIGSGKSTLLEKLRTRTDTEVIVEPVDEWMSIKDANGVNLLESFYDNPSRYIHLFQTVIVTTFLERHDMPQTKPIRICERSIETGKEVFVKSAVEAGLMNTLEVESYNKWYSYLDKKYSRQPKGIIYLRTSPEKCFERMRRRGRNEEDCVKLSYLKCLHELHDKWLFSKKYNTPLLVIDNNNDDDWDETLRLIDIFIND